MPKKPSVFVFLKPRCWYPTHTSLPPDPQKLLYIKENGLSLIAITHVFSSLPSFYFEVVFPDEKFYLCKWILFLKFLYNVIVRKDSLTQKFIPNSRTVSSPPWSSHPCFCLQLPRSRLDWGRTTRGHAGSRPGALCARSFQPDADGEQQNGNEMWSCGL